MKSSFLAVQYQCFSINSSVVEIGPPFWNAIRQPVPVSFSDGLPSVNSLISNWLYAVYL